MLRSDGNKNRFWFHHHYKCGLDQCYLFVYKIFKKRRIFLCTFASHWFSFFRYVNLSNSMSFFEARKLPIKKLAFDTIFNVSEKSFDFFKISIGSEIVILLLVLLKTTDTNICLVFHAEVVEVCFFLLLLCLSLHKKQMLSTYLSGI